VKPPTSSSCPDVVTINTEEIPSNNFIEALVDKAYAEDKSCRNVFTGNKGGYSIVKKSYTKAFAYSMVQDLCAPEKHNFFSEAFQLASMGQNDVLNLSVFNKGTSSKKDMSNFISTYAITYALGQRESDGNFKEGRDLTAGNKSLSTEESGLTQTSANSLELNAKSPLSKYFLKNIFKAFVTDLSKLEQKDRDNSCLIQHNGENTSVGLKSLFDIGGDCNKIIKDLESEDYSVSTNVAKCFRDLHKNCPSFSIKYGASVVRVNRKHNGPLVTHEELVRKGLTETKYAKPYMKPSCRSLFDSIAKNKETICKK